MTRPRLPDRRCLRRAIPRRLRHLIYDAGPGRRRRWRRVPGTERLAGATVALTFDDGPDELGTPPVLAALAAAGVRGTFFVLGERVRECPELTREIRARGHGLALHGMTHRRHDRLATADARAELEDGIEAIEEVAGERPRWYRPPYGKASPELGAICRELGLGLAYWSGWGFDWEPLSGAEIAAKVNGDLGPGTIVLLHDSARYAEREDAAPTAEALPEIVAAARAAGLTVEPLGEATG